MAADFSKIVNHPERDKIINKLLSGDSPKSVSGYLKIKYDGSDETHLRLPSTLLKEFKEKYLQRFKFIDKVMRDNNGDALDKKIAESLMNNKSWRERLEEYADKEIDFKKKIQQLYLLAEARVEQVFDIIQSDPKNFKGDYVLINYLDKLNNILEKGFKIVNEMPDTLIQNNISIQMVEQTSVVFQEAIREVLTEMDPEFSVRFMELLSEKLSRLEHEQQSLQKSNNNIDKKISKVDKLITSANIEEGEIEEDDEDDDDS